jgi:hypothetical protein
MRVVTAMGLLLATATMAPADQRRELGAHEHGHAKLSIAVEGTSVAMEIEALGLDVLAFEHPAATEADKAAVAAGKAGLADPLALFAPPAAAECKVLDAKVVLEQEDHEHDAKAAEEHAGEALHSQFAGRYRLACADPAALTEITFAWFDRFPNTKEVEVILVTANGQTRFQVERGNPPLAIGTAS